jgi:hypothetical protein
LKEFPPTLITGREFALAGRTFLSQRRASTEIGDLVRFRVQDVQFPISEASFEEEAMLQGKVVGFSDSGAIERAFAVVEVIRKQLVIVPVQQMERITRQ